MLELKEKTDEQLHELAKKYGLKFRKNSRREDIEKAIETESIRKTLEIEEQLRAQRLLEVQKKFGLDPKRKPKPSPETLAIEKSKRKYYKFLNLEEAKVDVTFRKGEKYRFHIFDSYIHVLPEWLVKNLRHTATIPVFEDRPDPLTGHVRSVRTGSRQRFSFEELGDAPDNAPFGVVLDEEIIRQFEPEDAMQTV